MKNTPEKKKMNDVTQAKQPRNLYDSRNLNELMDKGNKQIVYSFENNENVVDLGDIAVEIELMVGVEKSDVVCSKVEDSLMDVTVGEAAKDKNKQTNDVKNRQFVEAKLSFEWLLLLMDIVDAVMVEEAAKDKNKQTNDVRNRQFVEVESPLHLLPDAIELADDSILEGGKYRGTLGEVKWVVHEVVGMMNAMGVTLNMLLVGEEEQRISAELLVAELNM